MASFLKRHQNINVGAGISLPVAGTILTSASKSPELDLASRREFLEITWGIRLKDADWQEELRPYDSYFRHYADSCVNVQPSLEDFTHEDFCNVVRHVTSGTRRECETALRSISPNVGQHDGAIHDALRFVGSAVLLLDLSEWEADETIQDFLIRVIASESKETDRFRLPLSFNARVFDKVAGIKINWTRNLLSHLEVGSNMSSLTIFHHVKVLDLYEQSKLADLFPKNFFRETRNTLSLLLPPDKASTRWFEREQQKLGLDITAAHCRYLRGEQRQIQHFNFWRDRLIITKEMFDACQPNSLMHFWRDDRNPVQWWTFWIAIVVFLLTVLSVVEGALQVYKAYYPSRT